jgi:hypothetical protein
MERESGSIVRHEVSFEREKRECNRRETRDCFEAYERVQAPRETRRGCYQRYERVQAASRESRFVERRLGGGFMCI